jgi:hypothetical protein
MDEFGTPTAEELGHTGQSAELSTSREQITLGVDGLFRVHDRVHRRNGRSEPARWGTITGRDDGGVWLVLDNLGVTHWDRPEDLTAAVRGSPRPRHVPIQDDEYS